MRDRMRRSPLTCGHDSGVGSRGQCLYCQRADKNRRYAELRAAILAAYGGACVCCGETHEPFLQVDHVNSDGYADRKKAVVFYHKVRRLGFPREYQILCANCNHAKFRGAACPPRHDTHARDFGRTTECASS